MYSEKLRGFHTSRYNRFCLLEAQKVSDSSLGQHFEKADVFQASWHCMNIKPEYPAVQAVWNILRNIEIYWEIQYRIFKLGVAPALFIQMFNK